MPGGGGMGRPEGPVGGRTGGGGICRPEGLVGGRGGLLSCRATDAPDAVASPPAGTGPTPAAGTTTCSGEDPGGGIIEPSTTGDVCVARSASTPVTASGRESVTALAGGTAEAAGAGAEAAGAEAAGAAGGAAVAGMVVAAAAGKAGTGAPRAGSASGAEGGAAGAAGAESDRDEAAGDRSAGRAGADTPRLLTRRGRGGVSSPSVEGPPVTSPRRPERCAEEVAEEAAFFAASRLVGTFFSTSGSSG